MSDPSRYIVTGDDPKVIDYLRDPKTQGVIWRGAFTCAGISSAEHTLALLKANPDLKNNRTTMENFIPKMSEASDFVENIQLIKRFLGPIIGDRVVARTIPEPFSKDADEGSSMWHVDLGKVTAVGAPIGPTTQYLPRCLPGRFNEDGDFEPKTPQYARRIAKSFPNDALLIMKSKDYKPQSQGLRGVVHRRPKAKIEAQEADRFLVLCF